jgi:hypothetical protein
LHLAGYAVYLVRRPNEPVGDSAESRISDFFDNESATDAADAGFSVNILAEALRMSGGYWLALIVVYWATMLVTVSAVKAT